jgi:DNA-binding MarR family transcriptional regulator
MNLEPSNPLVEIISILTRKVAEMESLSTREGGFSDLSLRQIYYLDVISKLRNPTPTELAQAIGISKPSVTSAIDKLERLWYVRKVHSDEDRRSYHLHLTERGEAFSNVHESTHQKIAQLLTHGLNEEEISQLIGLVYKIVQNIKV